MGSVVLRDPSCRQLAVQPARRAMRYLWLLFGITLHWPFIGRAPVDLRSDLDRRAPIYGQW